MNEACKVTLMFDKPLWYKTKRRGGGLCLKSHQFRKISLTQQQQLAITFFPMLPYVQLLQNRYQTT